MANLIKIGSGATITWGTSGGVSGMLVIISSTTKTAAEVIPILDATGIPNGMVIVPGLGEFTAEGYLSGSAPTAGAQVNGYYLDSVEVIAEQKGIKKLRVSGKSLP